MQFLFLKALDTEHRNYGEESTKLKEFTEAAEKAISFMRNSPLQAKVLRGKAVRLESGLLSIEYYEDRERKEISLPLGIDLNEAQLTRLFKYQKGFLGYLGSKWTKLKQLSKFQIPKIPSNS